MKKISLKAKIKAGRPVIGSWLSIDNEIVAEIMARMGFDFITIDIEHTAIEMGMVQRLVRTIELNGCAPLVRVSENDPNLIKRVMDTGAHGVIVPMVKTVEEARQAVASVKYPPKGKRGVGLSRAQGYGQTFEAYRQWLDKESIVIPIIEHVDAIRNLEGVLSVDGVDATMIGPYDLSGSMGYPGGFDRADVKAAIRRYSDVCRTMKKAAGFHCVAADARLVEQKLAEGFSFLVFSVDMLLLHKACSDGLKAIRAKIK
jgi:2-dehydro-3-deoxyglucarate aldolase